MLIHSYYLSKLGSSCPRTILPNPTRLTRRSSKTQKIAEKSTELNKHSGDQKKNAKQDTVEEDERHHSPAFVFPKQSSITSHDSPTHTHFPLPTLQKLTQQFKVRKTESEYEIGLFRIF